MHSMLGRGARTRTFRARVRVRVRYTRAGALVTLEISDVYGIDIRKIYQ